MRPRLVFVVVATVLFPALMSGCLGAPELDKVRRDIERQVPGTKFKREVALSFGPVTLALARTIARLTPEAREAVPYLRDLRGVTVAVYQVEDVPPDPHVRLPETLEKLLARGEWELAVKTAEDGEFVWVLYKTHDDGVDGLYVVVLDHDNLVLVRARGRLESLVRTALTERAHISGRI